MQRYNNFLRLQQKTQKKGLAPHVYQKLREKKLFFALYNVYVRNILYLCTRYHAVLAPKGSEGVGAKFIGTASYNACFWTLETANFNNPNQRHCRGDASGGIITSRQCAEARVASRTLYGCIIFHGVSIYSGCLLGRFSQDLKRRTGRVRFTLFLYSEVISDRVSILSFADSKTH